MNVEGIAREIVAREGGYVDDPDDPGGATKYGVTIGTLRSLGLDLDRDGRVTKEDVKRLTPDLARGIFLRTYFYGAKIDMLPEALQASVFDMNVNAGSNAVKLLQKLLDGLGYDIAIDGAIGPQTARIAHQALRDHPDLADRYGIARRDYYYDLAGRRPASRKYAVRKDGGKGGWITRAEEFISPSLHLSDGEHRRIVRSWT
jgi:lysozyme family protein